MASVDTNVLVRLLTADDDRQSEYAKQLVRAVGQRAEKLFVPLTVTLELEWVLRSAYCFAKDQVLAAFSSLLETREFQFQDEFVVEEALDTYQAQQIDFAECLHLACAATAAQLPMLTFDLRAARVHGAHLIGT